MDIMSDRNSVLSEDLPEYLFSDSDSEMGTAVDDGHMPDRIYVHQLNLTSADIIRRQKEKEMVEEEKRKVLEMKEIKRRQKEEERKRDMEMLQSYNPWGKAGAGAKGDDVKRKTYPEGRIPGEGEDSMEGFITKFGRPGNGAPNRTESGRVRTQITGDPAIRFQDTQHVRLSIENHLRYKNEDKENYRGNLDELIQQKLQIKEKEKEWEIKKLEEMKEQYPFGRETDNGGSYLSHADPMFMATRPRRINVKTDDFDPWGKGFGNPAWDQQGNVQRHKFAPSAEEGIPDEPQTGTELPWGMRRNRGGDGAPHMTESGRPRARLRNTLKNIKSIGPHIDDSAEAYNPWGKPGAGAPFVRENDKPFEEKLGWSLTGHPKKRSKEAKQEYKETLEQEIEERKRKDQEERMQIQEPIVRIRPPQKSTRVPGVELASIIRRGVGGRPNKNPVTGELLPSPRKLTDVTQDRLDIRRAKSQESLLYYSELAEQAAQRQQMRQQQKQMERAQSEKHISTWESFWGRPGHGAPRDPDNHRKENMDYLLNKAKVAQPYVKHYITEIVPSKHKNRYEYPTKDAVVVKREYEFRTPYPATEA